MGCSDASDDEAYIWHSTHVTDGISLIARIWALDETIKLFGYSKKCHGYDRMNIIQPRRPSETLKKLCKWTERDPTLVSASYSFFAPCIVTASTYRRPSRCRHLEFPSVISRACFGPAFAHATKDREGVNFTTFDAH